MGASSGLGYQKLRSDFQPRSSHFLVLTHATVARPADSDLTLLGHAAAIPASPEAAVLERVPNPDPDATYLVRFACPEFTSLCPVTGQPDFAHLVIDYAPGEWLLESKSLKLFLASFRNHGGFHEGCTLLVGQAHRRGGRTALAADRRLLVSARRHPDRRVLADRGAARGPVAAGPGCRGLSRAVGGHGSFAAVNRQAAPRPTTSTGMNAAKTQKPAARAAASDMPSARPDWLAAIPVAAAPTA